MQSEREVNVDFKALELSTGRLHLLFTEVGRQRAESLGGVVSEIWF